MTTNRALAKAVERPMNRIGQSVCDDIYLILDTITWNMSAQISTQPSTEYIKWEQITHQQLASDICLSIMPFMLHSSDIDG